MIKKAQFAMLTMVDADGALRSRPMATQQVDFDGTLWFFTWADAAKVAEVRREPRVNASFSDNGGNAWVSASGRAQLVRDRAKVEELWSAPLKAWFPGGKDDPNLALLRVDVEKAEYWDSPSSPGVSLT